MTDETLARMLAHRRASVSLLSRHHPIPRALLREHADLWDWALLSRNEALEWDAALLAEHEDRWHFDDLRANPALPWSVELIETYVARGYWTWDELAYQHVILTSPRMLALCLPHWSRSGEGRRRRDSRDDHDAGVYRGFQYSAWGHDAHEWAHQVVERSRGLRWNDFSAVHGFPWTPEFIERHAARLDWRRLSLNPGLPWSIELLERFESRWHWQSMTSALPWSPELLERFESRWNWRHLGHSKEITWTPELLERFAERLWWGSATYQDGEPTGDVEGLVTHDSIQWTPAFFDRFRANVEAHFTKLARAGEVDTGEDAPYWTYYCVPSNWTPELVEYVIALEPEMGRTTINWTHVCYYARGIWTRDFVVRHRPKIVLYWIAHNPHFPWIEFLDLLDAATSTELSSLASGAGLSIPLLDALGDRLPTSSLLQNRSLTRELVEHLHGRWDASDWHTIYNRRLVPLDAIPDEVPWKAQMEITRSDFAARVDPQIFDAFVTRVAPGVEERSPELEAAIARAPDDPSGYAVYGDWLQLRGDPQGALIAAMVADDEPERIASLRVGYENLLRVGHPRMLVWRHGFVREAHGLRDEWPRLLQCRAFALLDSLAFQEGLDGPSNEELALLEPLRATLTRLSLCKVAASTRKPPDRLDRLATLTQLRDLRLDHSEVRDLTPLAGLGLRHLSVWNTNVERLDALEALPELTWLHIGHTTIADLGPLRACTQLVELDLRYTRVRDLSPLRGLQRLRRLFVQNTAVDERELATLREALPQVECCDYTSFWAAQPSPRNGFWTLDDC